MLTKLGEKIEALDPTLKNTVEKTREGIEFHLDKLRRRQAWRSIKKRVGRRTRAAPGVTIESHKVLQERNYVAAVSGSLGAGGLANYRNSRVEKRSDITSSCNSVDPKQDAA